MIVSTVVSLIDTNGPACALSEPPEIPRKRTRTVEGVCVPAKKWKYVRMSHKKWSAHKTMPTQVFGKIQSDKHLHTLSGYVSDVRFKIFYFLDTSRNVGRRFRLQSLGQFILR